MPIPAPAAGDALRGKKVYEAQCQSCHGTQSTRGNAVHLANPRLLEVASEGFPFILITGRQLAHYNSGTQTRRTGNLALHGEDLVEIHPSDAERLGIAEGDKVEVDLAGLKKTAK